MNRWQITQKPGAKRLPRGCDEEAKLEYPNAYNENCSMQFTFIKSRKYGKHLEHRLKENMRQTTRNVHRHSNGFWYKTANWNKNRGEQRTHSTYTYEMPKYQQAKRFGSKWTNSHEMSFLDASHRTSSAATISIATTNAFVAPFLSSVSPIQLTISSGVYHNAWTGSVALVASAQSRHTTNGKLLNRLKFVKQPKWN